MPRDRAKYLVYLMIAVTAVILARLFVLQVIRHEFLVERARAQRRRVIPVAGERGDIYDRHGRLLAASVDTFSVFVNPRIFTSYSTLEVLLGEKIERSSSQRTFAWVKRKIPPDLAEKIRGMNIEGVGLLPEKKRVYPKGRLASQVVGFVGMDNEGLSGIELAMEDYLKAEELHLVAESDPRGYELLSQSETGKRRAYSGANLYLTIDESVQYFAERELDIIMKEQSALSAMIIVADLKSGDILALAGKPDFDPNFYLRSDKRAWRSRAVDVFEPGSTFKTITAAAGLDAGAVALNTKLKAMDTFEIGGRVIRNSQQIKWDGPHVSMSKMFERSINTAVLQISMKMGRDKFYRKIRDFGFGDPSGIELQGESRGIVRHPSRWSAPDIAMISFGQGIAVTPIQLVSSFMAIANEGVLIKPRLIRRIENDEKGFVRTSRREEIRRVISKKAAEDTMTLLRNVCEEGSGRRARLDRYTTGGKTGTAQKAMEGGRGYMKDKYIASFIGIAPLSDPRIVCLVMVDEPRRSIWGEAAAGPGFKRVVEETLRYLNVRPDVI